MDNKRILMGTLSKLSGRQNVITVHEGMVQFLGGNVKAAMILEQLLYWSDKGGMGNGWFAKSHAELQKEIYAGYNTVSEISKKLETIGIIYRKIKKFNGTPTMHYRINEERLTELWGSWVDTGQISDEISHNFSYDKTPDSPILGNEPSRKGGMNPHEKEVSLTEITLTEITTNTRSGENKQSEKDQPFLKIESTEEKSIELVKKESILPPLCDIPHNLEEETAEEIIADLEERSKRYKKNNGEKREEPEEPEELEEPEKLTPEKYKQRIEQAVLKSMSKASVPGELDLACYPEEVVSTLKCLYRNFGLKPPIHTRRGKPAPDGFWTESAIELRSTCDEFGVTDVIDKIRKDYEVSTKERNGIPPYTVSSPKSLVNMARAKAAQMRKGAALVQDYTNRNYLSELSKNTKELWIGGKLVIPDES